MVSESMRRMICGLNEKGYLTDADREALERRLNDGETAVFDEIRGYLLRLTAEK